MKREYCLDIDGNVYTIGDLNMFLDNKEPISYPAADSQNPTRPFFTGTIRQEVEVNGVKRSFLLYIPQHYPISGAGIFLYPDDDISAEDYLENSGWKPVAEQTNAALIVLESRPGGWNKKDIQSEISYSEAVFKKIHCPRVFQHERSHLLLHGFWKRRLRCSSIRYAQLGIDCSCRSGWRLRPASRFNGTAPQHSL